MKAQRGVVSIIRRMIVVSLLVLISLLCAVSYNVLGGTQFFQTRSYDVSQLSADARTVAAALYYILEPEPDLDIGSANERNIG
jgi:hypothetical protein